MSSKLKMSNIETHPWTYLAPEGSQVLIVGTFPPTKRNWSFDFFYPNKRNSFWKILSAIAGRPLLHSAGELAVAERKELLRSLSIAISDMGQQIIRLANNSLDENLQVLRYMDIFKIVEEHPSIRKILFTSSSGKVSAARWFEEYVAQKGLKFKFPKGQKPLRTTLVYADRTIELVILYSPSARASNRIVFEDLVKLYQDEISTV